MVFGIGDLVVYPAHGVGKIEAIETVRPAKAGAKGQEFYVMRILDNNMKIMIPTGNAQTVGLRCLISELEVPRVYDILRERTVCVSGATWNRRYREYMDKIKTGSIFELANVLRDLTVLKVDKELSFGERKMLDTARSLLVKELSIVQGAEEDQVAVHVLSLLA